MDKFKTYVTQLDSPARNGYVPTLSDTVDLPFFSRKLWIGSAGDLNVIFSKDDSNTPVLLKNVPIGELNICVKRILVSFTGASDIVVLY